VFTYDLTDNRRTYDFIDPNEGAISETLEHNVSNEITEIMAGVGVVNPTYDDVGNMTGLPVQPGLSTDLYDVTWDAWNRIVAIEGAAPVVSYSYDGFNRRITQTDSDDVLTDVYHDPHGQRLQEDFESDHRQYTWGMRGPSDLVRRETGSMLASILYSLNDGGNVVATIDSSGVVDQRFSYDTYGQHQTMDSSFTPESDTDWNYLFAGAFQDLATGLYSNLDNAYDPRTGTTLSESSDDDCNPYSNPVYIQCADNTAAPKPKCHCCVAPDGKPKVTPEGKTPAFFLEEIVKNGQKFKVVVKGATLILTAKFENDDSKGCCCKCCEVRLEINPTKGSVPPVDGFKWMKAEKWQEDLGRGGKGGYGHRDREHNKGDSYHDCKTKKKERDNGCCYKGEDSPSTPVGFNGVWRFRLKVVDICHDGVVNRKKPPQDKEVGEVYTLNWGAINQKDIPEEWKQFAI
jgi:YD repeat-containing protein